MAFDELNKIKVWLQVFDDDGIHSGTWIDITKYVLQLGNTGVQIDSSDYDIGIFQNSNLTLNLNNRTGKFNDIGSTETLFNYKRKDSLIKITYKINEYGSECGIATLPFLQGDEVTIFKGLLNDESLRSSATQENANFSVLGFESIFDTVLVNFASLSNGDTIEEILYTILNQTEITSLITVSATNINAGLDQACDDVSDLEGQTVKEALEDLLLISNSVLYIDENDNVIVTARTASTTSQATFYGQASEEGPENIIDLKNYNSGLHRVINYFLWEETTTASYDSDSIIENGLRKKEISSAIFTDPTKRSNFMDALLAEFKDKKIEMEIIVPLTYETIALALLDKINIDYPAPVIAEEGVEVPIYGVAILGVAIFGEAQWTLIIESDTDFKILKKDYNFDSYTITLKIREV